MSRKAKSFVLLRCLSKENRQGSAPGEQAVLDTLWGQSGRTQLWLMDGFWVLEQQQGPSWELAAVYYG